jgi:parallel beta-helix repeat protein
MHASRSLSFVRYFVITALIGLSPVFGCGAPEIDDGDQSSASDELKKKKPDMGSSGNCDAYAQSKVVQVSTANQLEAALSGASAGTLIELANGTYAGNFVATASGKAKALIALCGGRGAVLQSKSGYGFHLQGSYWVLSGFSTTGGDKGIVLDGASNNLLTDLSVHDVGDEGIHFRSASSHNTLQRSEVRNTGKSQPGFGEGVYIGSAVSNWGKYGKSGGPDRSDGNQVIGNTIGNTSAENIDIKEGTTGGVIRDNHFDGSGMSGKNYADSWIDVKGNAYQIDGNDGVDSLTDGFQLHNATKGWGNDNVFHKNKATVKKGSLAFNLQSGTTGNVVGCDNTVSGGGTLSNVTCK